MFKVHWLYKGSKEWIEGYSSFSDAEDARKQVIVWMYLFPKNKFRIVNPDGEVVEEL